MSDFKDLITVWGKDELAPIFQNPGPFDVGKHHLSWWWKQTDEIIATLLSIREEAVKHIKNPSPKYTVLPEIDTSDIPF